MRFNPAPGWPPPPDGWIPPQGWQPPPDWPPAPPGWSVLVDDGENGHLNDEAENGTFEAGRTRPWYKKKRYLIPSGTLVAILAIAALSGDPDEPPPTSAVVEASAAATKALLTGEIASVVADTGIDADELTAISAGIFGFTMANVELSLAGEVDPEKAWAISSRDAIAHLAD